jgi:hypothetical protein
LSALLTLSMLPPQLLSSECLQPHQHADPACFFNFTRRFY